MSVESSSVVVSILALISVILELVHLATKLRTVSVIVGKKEAKSLVELADISVNKPAIARMSFILLYGNAPVYVVNTMTVISTSVKEWAILFSVFKFTNPCQFCHPPSRKALICPLSPEVITRCPCGKHALKDLNDGERKSCQEPIASCGKTCGKPHLDCGHICKS